VHRSDYHDYYDYIYYDHDVTGRYENAKDSTWRCSSYAVGVCGMGHVFWWYSRVPGGM
jgi:hypothetical protein